MRGRAANEPMNLMKTGQAHDAPPVQEMVVIHRILRSEFEMLAHLVRRVPDGHTERAEIVAEHIDFTLAGLHNHHSTEDESLWPTLLERARPSADLIHRMQAQHEAVSEHTERARRLLPEWRREPTRSSTSQLAETLTRLTDALVEHLDEEENQILPLVTTHVSAEEWEAFGQRAFDKFPRSALPIMLGQMLENATPEERAMFFGKLPAPVRLIWRLSGRRQYARYAMRVRATKAPGPVLNRLYRQGNRLAVSLYRRSHGRIGGSAKGIPVLLITVPGRRTGTPHTVPVAYLEHDGAYLVTGSAGGTTSEPQWFRNIRAAGHVHVELGDQGYDLEVRVPDSAERDRLWHDVVLARAPFFATYEQKAGRTIPVAVLTPLRDTAVGRRDARDAAGPAVPGTREDEA